MHPTEIRRITISETKAMASFPEGFLLIGSYAEKRWPRIGNSVPPLFMRAIAESVRGMSRG